MRRLASFLLLCPVMTGCGRSISVPKYTPDKAARAAFADYDANKDGVLDVEELERCPSLKSFARSTGKKKVTLADLEERLTSFLESKVGSQVVTVNVTQRGVPLVGAKVTLTPEKFLDAHLKPASGTTDDKGNALVQQEGGVVGAAPGFYRIQVSKKDAAGAETLPARFHSETILGEEVGPALRGPILLKLGE